MPTENNLSESEIIARIKQYIPKDSYGIESGNNKIPSKKEHRTPGFDVEQYLGHETISDRLGSAGSYRW